MNMNTPNDPRFRRTELADYGATAREVRRAAKSVRRHDLAMQRAAQRMGLLSFAAAWKRSLRRGAP